MKKTLDRLALVNEAVVVAALLGNIVLVFANTAVRTAFGQDMPWAPEMASILIGIICFTGSVRDR